MAIFFFVCRDRAQFQEEGKSGCREKFKTNLFWVWSTPVLKTIWAPLRGNTDLQKQNRAQKSYCSISLTNKKAKWNVKAVYLWFLQTWGPRIESRSFFRFFLNNRHIDMTHKHKNIWNLSDMRKKYMKNWNLNPGCSAMKSRLGMHGYFESKFWPKNNWLHKGKSNDLLILCLRR